MWHQGITVFTLYHQYHPSIYVTPGYNSVHTIASISPIYVTPGYNSVHTIASISPIYVRPGYNSVHTIASRSPIYVTPGYNSVHTIAGISLKIFWTKKEMHINFNGRCAKTAPRNCLVWVESAICQESSFAKQKFIEAFCSVHQTVKCSKVNNVWQSSRPASFSPAGLTLWPSWLERWLATLSGLSVQVWIPVGLSVPGHYIGGSSAGLGKAQRIDSSLRADWLSCFSLAWWEWWVARQGCLVPLRKGGMWQSSRPASFSPAGLTLWPSWLERWLATLSGLSVQVRIPVGLSVPGHYKWLWQTVCLMHYSASTWHGRDEMSNPCLQGVIPTYNCTKVCRGGSHDLIWWWLRSRADARWGVRQWVSWPGQWYGLHLI